MAFLPKFRNNKFLDIALLLFIFLVFCSKAMLSKAARDLGLSVHDWSGSGRWVLKLYTLNNYIHE